MSLRALPLSFAVSLFAVLWGHALFPSLADDFPPVVNSQNPADRPPTPEEAAAAITVPAGFRVSLFAGEPDVAQPIAFELDDRGRVWVVECYTYDSRNFSDKFRDRVLIFEDTDNDGRFDVRTVFWDRDRCVTGIAIGFGGVWLLTDGRLIMIPDENRDDIPDGEPRVMLDGFDNGIVGHNVVNGLIWGPDGWLYGRHGIQATSLVGSPGAAEYDRQRLNCSIWRFHPVRHEFEVVTHGTTNPWGLDYNDFGEFFFTNNVIGHLWHVVPGAHYRRMYGDDFRPHLYHLIDQCADHYHWDTGQDWAASRDAVGKHGELGGGHAHCGGMIYLGDNWPDRYRNAMFTCNVHGRRVNHDRLERHGSGYAGRHEPDFLFANQPWFRGVELKYGPDGGVYLADWTDWANATTTTACIAPAGGSTRSCMATRRRSSTWTWRRRPTNSWSSGSCTATTGSSAAPGGFCRSGRRRGTTCRPPMTVCSNCSTGIPMRRAACVRCGLCTRRAAWMHPG
jgi:putative membrane-bound dehydrogenase-like protein